MLEDTKPTTFSELVQISGLSHGTDVWLGNAQELIRSKKCTLKDVIGCRDDIMVSLIYRGLDPLMSFKIMESVRKGKGLTPEMEKEMVSKNIPDWYIQSCKKIKYMFPKAHAVAYVLMAVRIAYFKVHHPLAYYAAYFSIRAKDIELETITKGAKAIKSRIEDIYSKGTSAPQKDQALVSALEIALEMVERGFTFRTVDIHASHATDYLIDEQSLLPPFVSVPSLGENNAQNIIRARTEKPFLSKSDFSLRGKVSQKIVEFIEKEGSLASMPEQNQLSLFE
jgi:DNA polymerase-3 subunit alpha (Gram-positive type)